ncbi:MAG: hypothetical protein M3094_00060 [Actinomycetia bacterium]|nr:hypothetical protein [Actinomycetes bacterium]
MAGDNRSVSGRRRLLELLAFIAASTLVMFILSSIALLVYTSGAGAPTTVTLEIPDGSAELIRGGDNTLNVPPVWTFNAGDILEIDNGDAVVHYLGDWTIPPDGSTMIEISVTTGGEYRTSLHPLGIIAVKVEPSRFDFSIIAFSTFGFGIAVGVILFISVSIMRAMGHDDDDWTGA